MSAEQTAKPETVDAYLAALPDDARGVLEGIRHAGTKTTIRFTVDNPLPAALVEKIVKSRMRELERGS